MPYGTTIENSIIDHTTGKATWTAPTAFYVGLSSTTPTKSGTNITEPSGGAYARIQITAAQFNAAASGATQTNTDKSFTAATADWVSGSNLTHTVYYDAVTSGNFLGFAALGTARPVLNGDTPTITSGALGLAFAT